MIARPMQDFDKLAAHLRSRFPTARVETSTFPSGAASLSIVQDDRLFIMDFAPSTGFGVDEVRPGEEYLNQYSFTTDDFQQAAEKLVEIAGRENQTKLSLIVIYAADISKSKEFYETLGLSFTSEKHHRGPAHFSCQFGDAVFELYPSKDADSVTYPMRLGFQVDSVDTTLVRLKNAGIEPVTSPQESPMGRRAVIRDPDGNTIEINSAS
jgi:lactoylglutathione lyase